MLLHPEYREAIARCMPGPGIASASLAMLSAPLAAEERERTAVAVEAAYTSDLLANASGGQSQGVRYLDNLEVAAELDLEQIAGLNGTTARVSALYNNGTEFSSLVGDAQIVSNIETGVEAVRLYEAWIEQKLGSNASVRVGLYDLNSEFDVLETANLFIGSAHGIGTDIGQSGRNGPSIFPITAFAGRVSVTATESWTFRLAVMDGVPGDPAHPARTSISLGNGDGAFFVGEAEALIPRGKVLLGYWRYTAPQDLMDESGTASGSDGLYLRGEMKLWNEADDPDQGISSFLRLGIADENFVPFSHFLGAGLTYTGLLPGRASDQIGIAVAVAATGEDYRMLTGSRSDETAFELTYHTQLNNWFSLQPSLHYIANPQGMPGTPDALVLGLRTTISFSGSS